jgi:hypothetical protein
MMNNTFDDIARSLMEYYYILPLSGLHFIVHKQSLLLMSKRIAPTCRSTLQLSKDKMNPPQIYVLGNQRNDLAKCIMYFSRVGITLHGCVIRILERVTIECRKSDTLWMLVSAGLSMGLSVILPDGKDVERAVEAINNYFKYSLGTPAE